MPVPVLLACLSPDTVFTYLVNSSGAIAIFMYLMIAMAVIADQRTQLLTSIGSLAVVLVAYAVGKARGSRPAPAVTAGEGAPAPDSVSTR